MNESYDVVLLSWFYSFWIRFFSLGQKWSKIKWKWNRSLSIRMYSLRFEGELGGWIRVMLGRLLFSQISFDKICIIVSKTTIHSKVYHQWSVDFRYNDVLLPDILIDSNFCLIFYRMGILRFGFKLISLKNYCHS